MSSDVLLSRHRGDALVLRVRLAALFGFVFGFAMAFLTLIIYGNSVNEIYSERPTTLIITTGEEGSLYGSSSSGIGKSDPDFYEEVRIVCMVLTYSDNHEKAINVKETWGKRCNRLIFISNQDDQDLGAVNISVEDSHDNLWEKTRKAFYYVYENFYNEGDWFLKADDDTYILMENLRYFLHEYNPMKPIYFGHKFIYEENIYMSGGAGYVLSKEALRLFVTGALNNETLCLGDQPSSEDYEIGKCLANVGVALGNSMDLKDNTQRFHPLPLKDYVYTNTSLPPWLYNRSLEPIQIGPSCCSEYSISFHYLEPKDMYLFEFLLYRMQIHGIEKRLLRPLPNKISMEYG